MAIHDYEAGTLGVKRRGRPGGALAAMAGFT